MPPKAQLVVLATVLLTACHKTPEEAEKAAAPVQVTAVTQATIRRVVEGDGALFPVSQDSIMPEISAQYKSSM